MTRAVAPRPGQDPGPGATAAGRGTVATASSRVVHVWVAPPAAGAALVELLDDDERARRAALPVRAANAFTTGRALLRLAVAERAGVPPESVVLAARCPTCGGAHGRVRVVHPRGVEVSVTRSGPLVAVAVLQADGRGHRPRRVDDIGVDVVATGPEGTGPGSTAPFADVALGPRDRRRLVRVPAATRHALLTTAWARKEAVLKATGAGLRTDPRGIAVLGRGGRPRRVRHQRRVVDVVDLALPAPREGGTSPVPSRLGAGVVAAVAVARPWWRPRRRPTVVVRDGATLLAVAADPTDQRALGA
ncbi:4'-phosphopantetheinyl transferase family protein [Cellulomonas marina]|uniref:4'-phosphopantetheinyl transferase family protein n=1 Tax=Cellulomonas marina TaxID=988821 RepID=UPI0015876B8E|nr:4'-phosphopantetheinyl transferase superfamily protein [Cellulomonas marina]